MRALTRGLTLLSVLLAMFGGCGLPVTAVAQSPLPTTTVQDTVYNASGVPASGQVVVSWGAFTTASGASVPAGSTSATIGANGLLSMALAPDAGATPIGSYYTATFHLSDGTTSRQYWVVPETVAGGGPAKLAAIQNTVLPTSVAMQTVSKAYVDSAIAKAVTGAPAGGGTMAAQNATAVAVTGGTIDGTAIGATTPSTGKFSVANAPALTVVSNSGTPGLSYNALQSTCFAMVAGTRCYGAAFGAVDQTSSPSIGVHLVAMQTQVAEPNTFPAGGTDIYGHVSGFNLAAGLWPGAAFRAETQGANAGQIQTAYDMTPGITPTVLFARPSCLVTGTNTCNSAVLNLQGELSGSGSSVVSIYAGSDGNYHVLSPSGKIIADPLNTATSSQNYSSATNCLDGSIWTGSAATNDVWCYGVTYNASGANPHSQLSWTQIGSAGIHVWQFPSGTYLQDGGTTFKDNANNLFAGTYVNAPFHTQAEQAKITAASTIVPASGLFHLAGTTTVNVMTPPAGFTLTVGAGNGGSVDFVADAATPFAAGSSVGSVAAAFTTVAGTPYHCVFTPSTGLWYCK